MSADFTCQYRGRIPIGRMAREGVVLNFVGVRVVAQCCYWLLA